jgi:hypothetical protein
MRVDVNCASHDDMARNIHLNIRFAAYGRRNNAIILKPNIANAVPACRRINNMTAT